MNECTELWCLVLLERSGAIPVCLICNSTVAMVKSGNLKRYYETTHRDFHTKFPLGSATRKIKFNACMSSYKNSKTSLFGIWLNKRNQLKRRCVRARWIFNNCQKPLSDFDIVKECVLEIATALFEENQKIVTSIRDVPLSARNNTRTTEILATENERNLFWTFTEVAVHISLDESCDIVDSEQMSLLLRFFDMENKAF